MNFQKFALALLFMLTLFGPTKLPALELKLKGDASGLWVAIRNDESAPVQINRAIQIGSSRLAANLRIVIRDKNGVTFPLMSRIDGRLFSKSDYIALSPSEFAGRVFSWDDIAGDYALPEGKYVVGAEYDDQTGLASRKMGTLLSNEIWIEVDTKNQVRTIEAQRPQGT